MVVRVGTPVPQTVELFPPLQTRMRGETDDLRKRMCMPECRERVTDPRLLEGVRSGGSVRQAAQILKDPGCEVRRTLNGPVEPIRQGGGRVRIVVRPAREWVPGGAT